MASAQADFRSNDRDGNGVQDFWRKDARDLFATPGVDGRPIRLIEASTAAADARPAGLYALELIGAPTAGYWLRAIRHAEEGDPDPNRFAFCMYPDIYLPGRSTFIVDEGNTIFRKDLGHSKGIDVFPRDLRGEGWSKLD